MYCGLGELELCSPFVVGQSRAEHEAVLQLAQQKATADDFYPGATGTTALFLNEVRVCSGCCRCACSVCHRQRLMPISPNSLQQILRYTL